MANEQMTPTPHEREQPEGVNTAPPQYKPSASGHAGPDEGQSVVADNDLPVRAAGAASASAGAGMPGRGGTAGGTQNYGGVGLPGGAQRLGTGDEPTGDAGLGGTSATGGLSRGVDPLHPWNGAEETEVLPGGGTRPAGGVTSGPRTSPLPGEGSTRYQARDAASDEGAAGGAEPPAGERGTAGRGLPGVPPPAVPQAPEIDVNAPTWGAPAVEPHPEPSEENPVPEEPAPGLAGHPGPEAEV
jgi:hypothetical protein